MTYTVHSIFKTLQGEGCHAGRAAVFCRFTGCNLWTGREQDRATAVCKFCDTDFVGGKRYGLEELAEAIAATWNARRAWRTVVFTGGEPLLQLDQDLVEAMHARRFRVHVETNGTQAAPPGIDWITVSPKAGATVVLQVANELKIAFPQEGMDYRGLQRRFGRLPCWLQPIDGPQYAQNLAATIDQVMLHPQWRLSLQTKSYQSVHPFLARLSLHRACRCG